MLELKITIKDKRLYCVHFSVPANKVLEYLEPYTNDTVESDDQDFFVKDHFENEIFPNELDKRGIKIISPIDYRYFTKYSPNIPFMGVCRFIAYDSAFDVDLPTEVDLKTEELIERDCKYVNDRFNEILLINGLYFEEASNKANKYAKIDYELRYIENGKVFNVVKGQQFDMLEDDDIDPKLFQGVKIGDMVYLSEDKVSICALVQNITNRIPFTGENYDKDVMQQIFNCLDIHDFNLLKELFIKEYKIKSSRDNYIYNIIDEMVKNINYDVSDFEIDFYDELYSLPFENEYIDAKSSSKKKEIIKKKMLFNALSEKYSDDINCYMDLTLKVQDGLNLLMVGNIPTLEEIVYEMDKIFILDYCKNNNIKNINKEYK